MFERFHADARAVVIDAQHQAGLLGHERIGTEHLLLGLLAEPGTARTVLNDNGLTLDSVRAALKNSGEAPRGRLANDEDAEILRSIGIDVEQMEQQIERSFGPDALNRIAATPRRSGLRRLFGRAAPGHIPFSAPAKKVLELSLRETLRRKENEITGAHILLGLLRERSGAAAELIAASGLRPEALREATEAAMDRRAA